jgi:hypothetical protein
MLMVDVVERIENENEITILEFILSPRLGLVELVGFML